MSLDYEYRESAAGTRHWTPTKAYLERVEAEYPRLSGAEQVRLGWCKAKGAGRKLGKAKENDSRILRTGEMNPV